MKHVIIGNGTAGVIAAETIRKNAPEDEIVLIGDEPEQPYSRMTIPRLLAGEIPESGTWLRKDAAHFSRQHIMQMTGRVVRIDSHKRTLAMGDGSVLSFDRLLIASGATPRAPGIPGIDSPGVQACWTLEDARRIIQMARPGSHVLLIGAGFIGCLVMEALAARRVNLTVIEQQDRIMPAVLGEGAGRMIKQWCMRKGVRILPSNRVVTIGSSIGSSPLVARLARGDQLAADLIVHCTGTTPNIGFLKGSGIKCLQGVLIDASMQTNVPGIYAAGDCAESFDSLTGRSLISGVQPNAADQAYCAALNMSGKHAFQRGVRQIDVFDTMGLVSSSFGQWQGVRGGQWVELCDQRSFRYMRLEFDRDVLVGCNTVGITEYAGILRSLIQQHIRLGEWKDKLLQDPSLIKEAYTACVERHYMDSASAFHMPPPWEPEPAQQNI